MQPSLCSGKWPQGLQELEINVRLGCSPNNPACVWGEAVLMQSGVMGTGFAFGKENQSSHSLCPCNEAVLCGASSWM